MAAQNRNQKRANHHRNRPRAQKKGELWQVPVVLGVNVAVGIKYVSTNTKEQVLVKVTRIDVVPRASRMFRCSFTRDTRCFESLAAGPFFAFFDVFA